ncbi:prolyl oligopeptidase family serine peptidase [Novosphingobium sp. PhB165]|uniref:prolyl oligopeptidase family serine peptidase n=1 Tax=Novosphingobium sp. PhB165 TaxID=2485105 RepID=UPI0010482157|nr:prolyl oligopeptidase family serine peptidase [Novosphingobium sp. PhB165]
MSHAATPAPADPRDPPDAWIWLEDLDGKRAMDWVEAHNAKTEGRLEADPRYKTFYDEALRIFGAEDRIPAPRFLNGQIYNFWQDEQHLRGIWRRTSLDDYRRAQPNWQTVLDIDALGKAEGKSWVYKGADCLEPEQRLCLISLSNGGEDAVETREFDLASGTFVQGGFHLPRAKQSVTWEDADHLLVATEWTPGDVTESLYPYIVKRLARGRTLSEATEIFRGQKSDVGVFPAVLQDGQGNTLKLITRAIDFFHQQSLVIGTDGKVHELAIPQKVSVAGLVAGQVVFRLDEAWGDLPTGAVATAPLAEVLARPEAIEARIAWKPGPREALEAVSITRDRLLLSILDNVNGRLLSLAPAANGGWTTTALPLPDKLALEFSAADTRSNLTFASAEGFTTPSTLYLVDAATGSAEPVKSLPPRFDATGLIVEQREAKSTDGTAIPYFLVHRKDMPLDGSTPVLLNAYGGFQSSSTPFYSGSYGKLWLEHGGAFALANIRGGGEFGPDWHEAALKTKRQVAYDDFASVARDMIAKKITSPRRLGIIGGSNGGLLMGVEMTEFPELYNAVVIQVPLLDMIRISKIAAGASWQGEYGDVYADPEARAFWLKKSPYHALRKDVNYPEPYIFTTTRDDRVGPQHARKFAARMEELGLPFYFYENTEGGHGSGADIRQSAKTTALWMTYITQKLMD